MNLVLGATVKFALLGTIVKKKRAPASPFRSTATLAQCIYRILSFATRMFFFFCIDPVRHLWERVRNREWHERMPRQLIPLDKKSFWFGSSNGITRIYPILVSPE